MPTNPPCWPAGCAASVRPCSSSFSASPTDTVAMCGLSSMETSASAGCLDTKPAKVCSACVIRVRMSTVRWVSSSSFESELMSRSRILAKSAAWASRASSACPQEETISMSIWRRSASDSGMESSRRCCKAKAFCSVVVEWFIARVNGRVRSGPNSAVAMSSSSLPRRMDTSVETSSSRASSCRVSVGRDDSELVSPGSMARADSRFCALSFLVLRREAAQMPPPATARAPAPPASQPAPEPESEPAPPAEPEDPVEPLTAASASASAEPPKSSSARWADAASYIASERPEDQALPVCTPTLRSSTDTT